MEQINNDQTIKESSDVLGYQVQNIPQLDTSKISLVANVNPKDLRRINIVRYANAVNSGSGTIYTTPTDKDFYLCYANLGIIKDATSTSTEESLRIVIDGATQRLMTIPSITLTAQSQNVFISLNNPIKIDRNTAITINGSSATANITLNGSIAGYLV